MKFWLVMMSCMLQGESTLYSATPQESSAYTAVAASSSEDSDAPHDPACPSSQGHPEGAPLSLTAALPLPMAQHPHVYVHSSVCPSAYIGPRHCADDIVVKALLCSVPCWCSDGLLLQAAMYKLSAELYNLHAGQRHAAPSAAERLSGSEKRARRL